MYPIHNEKKKKLQFLSCTVYTMNFSFKFELSSDSEHSGVPSGRNERYTVYRKYINRKTNPQVE